MPVDMYPTNYLRNMNRQKEIGQDASWNVLETWLLLMKTVFLILLFPLNDQTFSLFIEIEKLVRVMHMVKADSTNHVKEVTKAVVEDDEVQFKWTLLTPVFFALTIETK